MIILDQIFLVTFMPTLWCLNHIDLIHFGIPFWKPNKNLICHVDVLLAVAFFFHLHTFSSCTSVVYRSINIILSFLFSLCFQCTLFTFLYFRLYNIKYNFFYFRTKIYIPNCNLEYNLFFILDYIFQNKTKEFIF